MSETSAAGGNSIGINGHDVHCKSHYPQLINVEQCLWCTVIRVVRDEEQKYALNAYNNGYVDGITDNSKILTYKTSQEDLDVEYWRGYNNGYMDGYSDAEAHYDDWVYTNDDITPDVGERRQ